MLIALDDDEVRAVAAQAVARGVKAIAILFLHSYRNPAHERRAKRIVEEAYPDLFVTASHELSQEYREYERTSTTAANAYVGPRVRSYLGEMDGHLKDTGFDGTFLVVQSSGGLFDIEEAQTLLHPHAGVRPGRRRHRHAHAVRQYRLEERHRLRHGRHHRQGRRHL